MKTDIIPNINDPSLILPYYRGDGQGFQFENPSFSPVIGETQRGLILRLTHASLISRFFLFILLSASLFASNHRIVALGRNPIFWPDDDANIHLFPQSLTQSNLAQTNGRDFKLIWGDETKWGFWSGDTSENDIFNFFWGKGNWGIGLGVNHIGTVEDDTSTAEIDETVLPSTINRIALGTKRPWGEIGLLYDDEFSHANIQFNFRRSFNFLQFQSMALQYKSTALDTSTILIEGRFDLFSNMDISENTTLSFAFGISNEQYNQDSTLLYFPHLTLGVESHITDWSLLRIGFVKKYDFQAKSGLAVSPSFGVGIHYGDILLDLVINGEEMFQDPVKYAYGRNENSLGFGFSLSYKW
jgi:hypothetical protein